MKNKLIDLNNHLFAQIERLSDEDCSKEKMHEEINRAKSITSLANQVINNGRLILDAHKALSDGLIRTGNGNPAFMGGLIDYKADKDV